MNPLLRSARSIVWLTLMWLALMAAVLIIAAPIGWGVVIFIAAFLGALS